jgi:ribonuclease HII
VGGVDEAGRGCIIGPLVVAGVSLKERAIKKLIEFGVKDSKVLSPSRRRFLYDQIVKIGEHVVSFQIQPDEIDKYVKRGKKYRKLNYLEAIYMAKIVDKLKAGRVYIDASDIDPVRFSNNVLESLNFKTSVIAEHHADSIYPVVSAASIIAKVERDWAIDELRKRHGDFGSGYPSDPRTIDYLSKWVKEYEYLPNFSRKSWKSWNRILVNTVLSYG